MARIDSKVISKIQEMVKKGTKVAAIAESLGVSKKAVYKYAKLPKCTFDELHDDANRSQHGGGRLFRNYVAQYMSLPSGDYQLSIVEIELTESVYAWVGLSKPLFGRPGGMEQVFLPNLANRGEPRTSACARVVRTYWLKF